jgi:beta-glucosidase
LVTAVAAANPNTVVILQLGAPVLLPWAEKVKAILAAYLGGEAGSGGIVDVLTGAVNPGGKLAETWPLSLADTPAYNYFPGAGRTAEYRESIFAGYRYYDAAEKAVAFPFGYGLSYTTFAYSDLVLDAPSFKKGDLRTARFTVTNSGSRDGAETVQLYVAAEHSALFRAKKELKGFEKVFLKAGEQTTITLTLNDRSFSYYNAPAASWAIESGAYRILIGASSRDIRLEAAIQVAGDGQETLLAPLRNTAPAYFALPKNGGLTIPGADFAALLGRPLPPNRRDPNAPFTINSTLGDIRDTIIGKIIWRIAGKLMAKAGTDAGAEIRRGIEEQAGDMPLRSMLMVVNFITADKVALLVKALNFRRRRAHHGR